MGTGRHKCAEQFRLAGFPKDYHSYDPGADGECRECAKRPALLDPHAVRTPHAVAARESLLDPENFADGPLCPRGCSQALYRVHKHYPNMQAGPYHVCPRAPEKALAWLLERIGSWSNARFDQHLRYNFGDQATEDFLTWLDRNGVERPPTR
jgi:hypothetical protein